MIVLVSKALPSIQKHGGANVGRLVTPRNWSALDETDRALPWAADNDGFSGFDADRYRRMLEVIRERRRHLLLFVTAPDMVADAPATAAMYEMWRDELEGLPVAYVLQDGATSIPTDIDALFVGGSTEYKLSEDAARWVREASDRGLWVHMGRVNTRRRIQYAKSIGCHSVDGTSSVLFTDAHLPWQKEHAAAPTQGRLSA